MNVFRVEIGFFFFLFGVIIYFKFFIVSRYYICNIKKINLVKCFIVYKRILVLVLKG